jgi:hypothetical protein
VDPSENDGFPTVADSEMLSQLDKVLRYTSMNLLSEDLGVE